ncbi:hypothetical protein V2I01_32010 [Micromonospora sp. BRA006-A]|nr:hypothetical protein [Micromonospora sp. BRA006-A]
MLIAANAAANAAIFGVFGMAWFGWAQEAPPKAWRPWLGVGSVSSLAAAIAGGVVTVRTWDEGSSVDDRTGPVFRGDRPDRGWSSAPPADLAPADRPRASLVPAWIALIVGLHFFPLAPLLGYPASRSGPRSSPWSRSSALPSPDGTTSPPAPSSVPAPA